MNPMIKFASIGVALATCAAASVADAGFRNPVPVSVYTNSTGGAFYGTVAGARYSSDSNASLGCETNTSNGQTPYAFCWAVDATDKYAGCTTTDPNMIAVAGRANAMSYFWVEWNTQGTCTVVDIDNRSGYIN
jgi:hypothetical protein